MTRRVVHVVPGLQRGGAELMLARLVASMDPARWSSEVISLTTAGPVAEAIEEAGVPVRALGMRVGPRLASPAASLAAELRRRRPDLVQTWLYAGDLLGGLAARAAGVPAVAWNVRQSALDPDRSPRRHRAMARACARLSGRVPDVVVAASRSAAEAHRVLGYDADRLQVLYNGFDLDRFRPDAAARKAVRDELRIRPGAPVVALVGRLDPYKEHRDFLAAMAVVRRSVRDLHVLLAGEGVTADDARLGWWMREAGLEGAVHLLGPRDDLPRLLAATDVLASSSSSEGLPNVVGEAMAAGVPCVVTDVGDSALLVGETCRVVPPRKPAALASAVVGVLDIDGSGRARLGAAARARIAQHFSLAASVAGYEQLYERLTTGAPAVAS